MEIHENNCLKEVDEQDKEIILKEPVENFKKPIFVGKLPSKKVGSQSTISSKSESVDSSEIKSDSVEETSLENNEKSNKQSIPVPYIEPEWKGVSETRYQLEEVKSGVIERTIDLLNKSFISIGRIDSCDIAMAHPTISRFHAILQYRGVEDAENDKGFYLYDLNSTHGTFLNKYKIKPKVYARVKVGHMIKFGCSTRFFILKGPEEDEEEESPLSVADLKAQRLAEIEDRKRIELEEELRVQQEKERQERLLEERGITWGMAEDADEELDLAENPYAQETNEELYIDDPKRTLRNWFEREGEELIFDVEKAEKGLFLAKVILPIDRGDGREISVEMTARNKKEAQVQCALEACKIIDRMGLLRAAKRESRKQQKRNWEENDYYDSDEDSFLDRTGDLDKKREKRMRKAGKILDTVETYDSLMAKHKIVLEKLDEAEKKLNKLEEDTRVVQTKPSTDDIDELDAYMMTLKQKQPQKIDIKIAKNELNKLHEEEANLRKLINIAKPANLPELIYRKKESSDVNISNKMEIEENEVKIKIDKESKIIEKDEKKEVTIKKDDVQHEVNEKLVKVIGPTIPANIKTNKDNKMKTKEKQKKLLMVPKENEEEDQNDSEVYSNCVWRPPAGQTGDGRTALNDKYGY